MDHREILDAVQNARLLVIGDVMLDRYWWGSVERISPEAPVPVVRLDHSSLSAGGAANVALNLAGLGCFIRVIGVTGDDQEATDLEGILEAKGVQTGLVRSRGRSTIVKTRIVANSQHVVRIDQESVEPLSTGESDRMLNELTGALKDVDAVILSDYGKGTFAGPFLSEAISIVRATGKPLFVDPKGSKFDKYAGVTAITPNQREAMTACSIDPHVAEPVVRAGRELTESLGSAVLITEGDRGMTLFEKGNQPHHLDSFAREVFDVTGTGDTVIAVFAAAVAANRSMKEAAWIANIAAGIVVGRKGTTAITREMIDEFVASTPRSDLGLGSTA